jgi:hypothetical protein
VDLHRRAVAAPIPDKTKAIIVAVDPLAPRITPAFLEVRAGTPLSHRTGAAGMPAITGASNAPSPASVMTASQVKCLPRSTTVDKAVYSIPHPYVGQWLTVRADAQIVRFYARGGCRRADGARFVRLAPYLLKAEDTPGATGPRSPRRATGAPST